MDFRKVILANRVDSLAVISSLVAGIRPGRLESSTFAISRIKELIELLKSDATVKSTLASHAAILTKSTSSTNLFTQSGLVSSGGFFSDIAQKLKHAILPPVYDPGGLDTVLNTVFHKAWDHKWVEAVPAQLWVELIGECGIKIRLLPDGPELDEFLNSILILSHRIVVFGLDPVLISKVPGISNLDSPFFQQNREITDYVDHIRSLRRLPEKEAVEYKYILNTLENCVQKILYVHLNKDRMGASMGLTYLTMKLDHHVQRIRILLKVLHEQEDVQSATIVRLFKELVYHENTKFSITSHISANIGLLAYQVSEHAAKTGEHYISNDRREYFKFLMYSMGGGAIVAFLVCIKIFIGHMHYPPFIEAFINGLNYGLGFLVIHFAGFTLATKQPAMTASTLAGSLEGHANDNIGISNLAALIVKISRTQFISFAGNLLMVFPVTWLLSFLYFSVTGHHMADQSKANDLINQMHPVYSLSIWYAAIAGMLLYSAGLISGYFDNKSVFNRIPERIFAHPLLSWIPTLRRQKIADYIGDNLGSMSGNFMLGFLLASMAFFGFILGLPLDVRHVTFVTGNFGLATECLEQQLSTEMISWTLVGIFVIGFFNFIVSFGLAIFTAIKARNVKFKQTWKLINLLKAWFFTYPLDFFFPPARDRNVELVDDEKHVE